MALFGRKSHQPVPAAAPTPEPFATPHRSVDDQLAAMLAGLTPLRPFGMQIKDVPGLTLCEDIVCDIDLPLVTTARFDGFGVRVADLDGASRGNPVELRVTGVAERRDVHAAEPLPPGGCVQVVAGAPVPAGVDAVVPLGSVARDGQVLSFDAVPEPESGLTMRGSSVADGTKLLDADTVLDAVAVGVLAELGLDKVLVRPRPRVVVFAVGADLVSPGHPLVSVGQSYSAATALLGAASRADGATVYPLDPVRPEMQAVRQAVHDQSIRADLMVLLAATDADAHLAGEVLARLGPVDRAWVSLDGGREITIGSLGDERTPVVVLPGSPVAAYVAHRLLVRPMLARLSAREATPLARVRRLSSTALAGGEGVRHIPVRMAGEQATPVADAGGFVTDLLRADALAEVPASGIAAGAEVDCLLLPGAVLE